MLNGISILLPVYNIEVSGLVKALHKQASALLLPFEIRVYDDASSEIEITTVNTAALANLPHVIYKRLEQNVGRAAIRNNLAADAKYATLLFIDADSALPDNSFIKAYKQAYSANTAIIGGTIEQMQPPAPALMLRWAYSRQRESRSAQQRNQKPYASFTLNNLLIDKELFLSIGLNENITSYGHEDTAFGEVLQQLGTPVLHIDNPVMHTGLEPATVFLEKTEQAVNNLANLYLENQTGADSALVKAFAWLQRLRSEKLYISVFSVFKGFVLRNLKSEKPNLRLFDLYKLYLFSKAVQEQKLIYKN